MLSAEYEETGPIHHQTQNGDDDGLVEKDIDGVEQPADAFPGHDRGEQGQQDGARETAQCVDLAGAETVSLVVGMFAGVDVGNGRNPKGHRVRRHVQSVREERHGPVDDAADDLDDHGDRGDGDDDEGSALARAKFFLAKRVIVLPLVNCFRVHEHSPGIGPSLDG